MLRKQLDDELAKWKQIVATDIPAYDDVVKKEAVPAIILTRPNEPGTAASR
jgi:hypothetical protein